MSIEVEIQLEYKRLCTILENIVVGMYKKISNGEKS